MLTSVGTGDILLADRAYDSDALRQSLERRGAWGNIALMPNRKRRPPFSAWLYRQRNAIERFFNKLKHFRAAATRSAGLARRYACTHRRLAAKPAP